MHINKKIFISILCIIVSLILLGNSCLEAVGLTKAGIKEISQEMSEVEAELTLAKELLLPSDELEYMEIDANGLIKMFRSTINPIKDGVLTYKELHSVADAWLENKESMMNLWEYLQSVLKTSEYSLLSELLEIGSGEDSEASDELDNFENFVDNFEMSKLYRYIGLANFVATLIPITAIITILACILWNRRIFGVPYMLLQLIVATAIIFACIKINNIGGDVRITFATWFIPLLSIFAVIFMDSEKPLQAFRTVNVSKVKEMVQSKVESAEKFGSAAVAGISTLKKESYKWTCPSCGFKNPDENNFCGSCGAKRPELSDDAKRMIADLELQISNLTAENEQLKTNNESELKKALSTYEEQNKTLTIKRDALLFEVSKLKEELKQAEELNTASSEVGQETAYLKTQIESLELDNAKATEAQKELKDKIKQLESEKTDIQNKLEAKIKKLESGETEVQKDLENKVKQLESEKASVEETNTQLHAEIAQLKEAVAAAKSNNRKFCRYCGKTLE